MPPKLKHVYVCLLKSSYTQVRLGALSSPAPPVNLATCYRKPKKGEAPRASRRPSFAEKFASGAAAVFTSATTPATVPTPPAAASEATVPTPVPVPEPSAPIKTEGVVG
jgi:hypothetical protein